MVLLLKLRGEFYSGCNPIKNVIERAALGISNTRNLNNDTNKWGKFVYPKKYKNTLKEKVEIYHQDAKNKSKEQRIVDYINRAPVYRTWKHGSVKKIFSNDLNNENDRTNFGQLVDCHRNEIIKIGAEIDLVDHVGPGDCYNNGNLEVYYKEFLPQVRIFNFNFCINSYTGDVVEYIKVMQELLTTKEIEEQGISQLFKHKFII